MARGRLIIKEERFKITVQRLCQQLIENYGDFQDTCIIGVQDRGVFLAERIADCIKSEQKSSKFDFGKLDITFYRDDFRTRNTPLQASRTEIDFLVENKKVILVDDVLYTGRTIQAAMSALLAFGRPATVELLVMVDRRFNRHLPIKADYTGITIDAVDDAYVRVELENIEKSDRILMFSAKR